MRRTARASMAALLLLTACATSGGSPGSTPRDGDPSASARPPGSDGGIDHPGGDEAVLVVSSQGGFVPVEFTITAMPSFVMLGDGRVIVQGPIPEIYPGPALPNLQVRTLTSEGIQTVLDGVEDTGLFTADLELRGLAAMVVDAADTVFTLNAAGRQVNVTVYALGLLGPDMQVPQGMSSAEVEAHRVLAQLNDALFSIDTSVPADQWETDGWRPFEPDALRLYVRDVTGEPADETLPEDVRDWPIAGQDPASFGEDVALLADGTRCGAVEGEAAATWLAQLSEATQLTRWTTDGSNRFSVVVRPVLPHEDAACPVPVG